MNKLTIEGWCKMSDTAQPTPMRPFSFYVNEQNHLKLEEAEERLQNSDLTETFVDIDSASLELETPTECGELSDCRFRVYLDSTFHRGQFHLVGHRASDGSHIYTNAVMIDQLG